MEQRMAVRKMGRGKEIFLYEESEDMNVVRNMQSVYLGGIEDYLNAAWEHRGHISQAVSTGNHSLSIANIMRLTGREDIANHIEGYETNDTIFSLSSITSYVEEHLPEEWVVVLFGSVARNTHVEGSDIDLLCIRNETTVSVTKEGRYDLTIIGWGTWENRKHIVGTLENNAWEEGILIKRGNMIRRNITGEDMTDILRELLTRIIGNIRDLSTNMFRRGVIDIRNKSKIYEDDSQSSSLTY